MADAEESPSSLAELEALAGLNEAPAPGADDAAQDADAQDADAGDFDLASLAASTVVDARIVDTEEPASGLPESALAPAVVSSPVAPPSAAASTAQRGSFGFVYGLIAGVAVAGVLFFALRPSTAPVASLAEPSSAATAAPTSAASTSAAKPPVTVEQSPSVALSTSTASPAPSSAASSSKPRPPSVSAPRAANPAPNNASPVAASSEPTNADPTRPPDAPVPEPADAPSRPIDSLLDDALGSGKRGKQAKPASNDNLMGAELPATPTAADVTKVVQVLLPAIRGCAMGQSGVANTLLVVRNDGGVATASITGAPFAGAASGRCMEGVLRRAKFPRFQQNVFRVQFPLSIRATP